MRPTLAVLLVVLALGWPSGSLVAQEAGIAVVLTIDGPSLLSGDDARVQGTVTLESAADLRLRVTDFDGRTVRELEDGPHEAGPHPWSWGGRDDEGEPVPKGPYRIEASADSGDRTGRAEAWVAVADRRVYPTRPGFITVAVDPGHGGTFDGAVGPDGTREADLNLDIGLRLARMLEAAGVNVVITRTADGHVNEPPEDRSGDGVVDDTDELAARPDLANAARADLFLSIHNNIAVNTSVGGPSTFYFDERPFGGRSARLARIVQSEMVKALGGVGSEGWQPHDHGALIYPYFVLRDYDPPRLRRPTQMPGVLSEGMFLSNPRELRYLKRPAVRQAMAAAYYEAVARYLAGRGSHVGYELLSGPAGPVTAGETLTYGVEVRNQGTEVMRGWQLVASAASAPARYVGRLGRGTRAGRARVPRIAPGKSAVVEIEVTAPEPGGEWMLVFDARDRDGRDAWRIGSPPLQVRLSTLDPVAPSPSPAPSAEAVGHDGGMQGSRP